MANTAINSAVSNQVRLPMPFIKNQGQEDERTCFSTHVRGRKVFFSSDRITLVELEQTEMPSDFQESHNSKTLKNGVALELSFTGANVGIVPQGVTELPGYHYYLKSAVQNQWTTGVLSYEALRYPAVWEGVDLELYGSETGLKMNWVLKNPTDVSSIALHWAGADSLELDDTGNLLIHHVLGTMTDPASPCVSGDRWREGKRCLRIPPRR